jgi:hypothetical protein
VNIGNRRLSSGLRVSPEADARERLFRATKRLYTEGEKPPGLRLWADAP